MAPWRHPSQRTLFSALVVLITLIFIISYSLLSIASYKRYVAQAEVELRLKAGLLSVAHEQWLAEVENLLAAVAAGLKNLPDREQGCRQLFTDYLTHSRGLDTLLMLSPEGDLLCASEQIAEPMNFSDRRYYQRAMQSGSFAVGNFIIGRVSGQPVLPLALPVLDDAGEVEFLLVAGRTLDWVQSTIARQYASSGVEVSVVDGQGSVLGNGVNSTTGRGMTQLPPQLLQALGGSDSGVQHVRIRDVEYIFGFARLGRHDADVFVLISQPAVTLLQPVQALLGGNLLQLLIALLLMLVALWVAIGRWMVSPLQRLASAMDQVRAGEESVRLEQMGPSRELVEIGASFNEMRRAQVRTEERLRRLADHDGLLGIPNRRLLDEALHSEWRRMMRDGEPLSLLMVDVDLFKRYNDRYGHQAGDECLKGVVAVLSGVLRRPGDLVARYGGEEFVVLLPQTDEAGAMRVAEEIRHALAQRKIPHADSPVAAYVTVSIGLATTVPAAVEHVDSLLEQADQALYRAKQRGRDRVEVYSGSE